MITKDREGQLAPLLERTLGRYEIAAFLGAGGMGEVYRARDTQLGRDVALKILPESFASDSERLRRFANEARAVARLSHPNIMTIHDFGNEDGVTYAVMELLEGESLRQRLQRGSLPVRKAIDIASQIADGLSAAHHGRVIHRDIKPENVFISPGGQVKILDFGIAHLREEVSGAKRIIETEDTITDDVRAAGTLAYMSPEQLRGQRVGPATDIFSLGCVLYEMLTQTRPFQRSNSADTVSAILHHDPPPITDKRPEAPPVLAHLVTRCLEKQPDERFESARDLAFALRDVSTTDPSSPRFQGPADQRRQRTRRLVSAAVAAVLIAAAAALAWRLWFAPPPPLPTELRLAVMPFENNTTDRKLDLVAAGMTELVTENLTLFEGREGGIDWVVPQDAVSEYTDRSIGRVHQTFNNSVTIVGQLGRHGDDLALTLEVIEPGDRRRLRRSRIENTLGNLQALQQSPVLLVAEMLGIEHGSAIEEHIAASSTTSIEAFDAYIRARGLIATFSGKNEIDEAVELLDLAARVDPLFVASYVQRGMASAAGFELTGDPEWIESGVDSALAATRNEASAADAWRVVGTLLRLRGELTEALNAFESALSFRPDDATTWSGKGLTHQGLGQYDQAEKCFERAIYLRPGYWPDYRMLGKLHLSRGEYEAAILEFRRVIEIAPEFALGYVMLGGVNMFVGRMDTARGLFERSLEIEPTYAALSNLGTLHFQASRFGEAATLFERALELDPTSHTLWGHLGYAYKFGNRPDLAEETFLRAVELAEAARAHADDDPWLAADLADYYAMLDASPRGLELIEEVAAAEPSDPQLIAWIAEVFEDLGDRERALEWVSHAFARGIPPDRFEDRPTLRGLIADERFRSLVNFHQNDKRLSEP